MELGVEVCMTECVEEVVDMTVVCSSNEHRFSWQSHVSDILVKK